MEPSLLVIHKPTDNELHILVQKLKPRSRVLVLQSLSGICISSIERICVCRSVCRNKWIIAVSWRHIRLSCVAAWRAFYRPIISTPLSLSSCQSHVLRDCLCVPYASQMTMCSTSRRQLASAAYVLSDASSIWSWIFRIQYTWTPRSPGLCHALMATSALCLL